MGQSVQNQKGLAAIYLTILTMAAILIIGMSVSLITYNEEKITQSVVKSEQSYFAAESGVEDALLRIKKSLNLPSQYTLTFDNKSAEVSVSSPNAITKIIQSKGSSGNTFRKVETNLSVGTTNPQFFYGAQVGTGGIELENLSGITGNVFSNGNIIAAPATEITGTVQVSGAGNKIDGAVVGGSAYVNICNNSNITGTLSAFSQTGCAFGSFVATSSFPAPVSLPISDQDIADWKAEAETGGVINGNQLFSSGVNSLGPVKIVGDLTVQNDAEIVVTGTLWVTGNIIIKNNAQVHLSFSYGLLSGVVIADGTISLENNSISSGSGQTGSYLMYLSASALNPALTIRNNARADVLYTSSGWLQVENNTNLKEVTGYGIRLKNNARITYEVGLQSALFTSGPGGSWEVTSWKEIQ